MCCDGIAYLISDDKRDTQRCHDGEDVSEAVGDTHQRTREVRGYVDVGDLEKDNTAKFNTNVYNITPVFLKGKEQETLHLRSESTY